MEPAHKNRGRGKKDGMFVWICVWVGGWGVGGNRVIVRGCLRVFFLCVVYD